MPPKKVKNSNVNNILTRVWKATGPEQMALDHLFESGRISEIDSPAIIRKMNPLFEQFSPKIFAVHFRKTKAKLGGMRM